MKDNSTTAKKVLEIINLILSCVAMALLIHNFIHASGYNLSFLSNIIQFAALVCTAIFCMACFKKDAGSYYLAFIYAYAISELFRVAVMAKGSNVIGAVCTALVFGLLCILTQVKDYGKKKTLIIGFIVFAANAFLMISALVKNMIFEDLTSVICGLILSIVLILSILAKYQDKAERGSK